VVHSFFSVRFLREESRRPRCLNLFLFTLFSQNRGFPKTSVFGKATLDLHNTPNTQVNSLFATSNRSLPAVFHCTVKELFAAYAVAIKKIAAGTPRKEALHETKRHA
jgi:hypothetical protein